MSHVTQSSPPTLTASAEYDKPVSGAEGERTSLAYIQLEKHNERLKEALIRCVLSANGSSLAVLI